VRLEVQGRSAFAYTGGVPFEASLPCVVFIHGALNDHSVWALQSRYLAHHGYGVLAVDLPGHGQSDGPALASVEAMSEWLLALITAAGVQRCSVVGHSMGSLIALETAAALGEYAERLVMVATAFPMKVSEALLATAREDPLKAIGMVNVFEHSTLAPKPSSPGPGTWLPGSSLALKRRQLQRYMQVHDDNLFLIDFGACDAYAGAMTASARVKCPVHFILGARDSMTLPKAAGELARALRAEVSILLCGHSLMGEAPDGLLRALLAGLLAGA
jgi:pimeloyl-ACP methyl ester carboxylesterase